MVGVDAEDGRVTTIVGFEGDSGTSNSWSVQGESSSASACEPGVDGNVVSDSKDIGESEDGD